MQIAVHNNGNVTQFKHTMSRLQLLARPFVVFDPTNKEHRSYYYTFVQSGSWGFCPVRFLVPDDYGDLITMIQRSLLRYYVEKEFTKGTKWTRGY